MIVAASLVVAALAAQSSGADSLRLLAMRLPESGLVVEVRTRPLPTREALTEAFALSIKGSDEALSVARRLADAYAAAWADSFLVREVDRFARSSPGRRASKVWVDSVRRAGIAAYGRDGPGAAIRIWRRALARAVAIRDSAGIGAVLGNIGAGLWREGRLDSAEIYLERARRMAAAIGDIRVEANALGALANVSADRGDLSGARERHTRALALRERIGDTRGVAADHNNLGLLAQDVGDLSEARRRFEAALALNRRDGRDEIAATNLVNLAGLATLTGNFADAEGLYRDALSAWRERDMWAETADALRGLAQIEMRRGNYPAARSALRDALAILDRTGPEADAIATRSELAAALAAAGELQGALDELRRAQRRADSTGAPSEVRAGIALARADLAVQLNAFAQADQLYVRAERLYRLVNHASGEAEAQQGRGALFLEREDYARAQNLLETALRTQLGAGGPPRLHACRSGMSPGAEATRRRPAGTCRAPPSIWSGWAIPSRRRPHSANRRGSRRRCVNPRGRSRSIARRCVVSKGGWRPRSHGACVLGSLSHDARRALSTTPPESFAWRWSTSSSRVARSCSRNAAPPFSPTNGTCTPSSCSPSARAGKPRWRSRRASDSARGRCSSCCRGVGCRHCVTRLRS